MYKLPYYILKIGYQQQIGSTSAAMKTHRTSRFAANSQKHRAFSCIFWKSFRLFIYTRCAG